MCSHRRLLAVFWEGTSNTLEPLTTQIGLFAKTCQATEVNDVDNVPSHGSLKKSFDGCGVTNGNWGVLFATGLDAQASQVIRIVEGMLGQQQRREPTTSNADEGVHVVAVGLSRGGIACMKLAQLLARNFKREDVTASMLLFDPVPGNAVSTGFPWTAGWSQDLSQCHNLLRILAVYPYEKLPDIAMHAPTLCRYNHTTTLVQEDATLGCHQGALLMPTKSPRDQYDLASNLSARRIADFLELEGVTCTLSSSYIPTPAECIQMMGRVLRRPMDLSEPLRRKTHDRTGRHRSVVRYSNTSKLRWLNKHHEQLTMAVEKGNFNTATLEAVFGVSNGPPAGNNRSGSSPTNPYLLDLDEGYVSCTSW